MKTTILSIIFLLFAVQTFSQDKKTIEAYQACIKQFDLYHELDTCESYDGATFWRFVANHNPMYQKFSSKLSNYKIKPVSELSRDAAFQSMMLFNEEHNIYDFPDSVSYLYKTFLIGKYPPKKIYRICVEFSDDWNAFSTPDGIICITDKLIDNINFHQICGVLAHECAHYILEHALVNAYYTYKKQKKAQIWAAIGGALSAGAIAYGESQAPSYDKERSDKSQQRMENIMETYYNIATEYSVIKKFKYAREQEIEADILAYRFLQYKGMPADEYINVLKILDERSMNSNKESKYDDHPSLQFRIGLLKYMKELDQKGIKLADKYNKASKKK